MICRVLIYAFRWFELLIFRAPRCLLDPPTMPRISEMRSPQRTIEEVFIEGKGPLTSAQLLAMHSDEWGFLRDEATRFHRTGEGLSLRCHECGGPVYVKAVRSQGELSRPMFAHYKDADRNCPWFTGDTITPDDARAEQYQGQQVSAAHEQICALIEELVRLDSRYIRSTRGSYLPPVENERGRYPDVYVEWEGVRPFVVEYQRSSTFQNEVTDRTLHYAREGISLLWVFSHLDQENLKQSFQDVIRRHRGNAFVLDQAAVAASREQRTLVLSCYLRQGNTFGAPVLVRYDSLKIPKQNLPFYEDRIVEPLLERIDARRRPYFLALAEWVQAERVGPIKIDELQALKSEKADRLIAAAFSIVATANGSKKNYASRHPELKEMLNTFLDGGALAPYADLLERLIRKTALRGLMETSVKTVMDRVRNGWEKKPIPTDQVDEYSAEWQLLRDLLPEALDPVRRAELDFYEALPEWAV